MNLPEQQTLQILYEFKQAINLKENELRFRPSEVRKVKTCNIEWLKEYANKIIGTLHSTTYSTISSIEISRPLKSTSKHSTQNNDK